MLPCNSSTNKYASKRPNLLCNGTVPGRGGRDSFDLGAGSCERTVTYQDETRRGQMPETSAGCEEIRAYIQNNMMLIVMVLRP